MTKEATVTNPLIAPYLRTHLDFREAVRRITSTLTDEELDQVLVLFHHQNLRAIPAEFWVVAAQVRLSIKHEKQHREHLSSLTGAHA